MFKKILLFTAIASIPLYVHAESPNTWYGTVDVGVGIAQGDINFTGNTANAGGTPTGNLEPSAVVGVAVGFDAPGPMRYELKVQHHSINSDTASMSGIDASSVGGYNRSSDVFQFDSTVKSTRVMALAYYDFNPVQKITPYVKAGVGQAWNRSKTTLNATINSGINGIPAGFSFGNYPYAQKTRTDFAWTVGMGASYPLSTKLGLNLEYTYNDLGKGISKHDSFGDAIVIKKLSSHDVTLGLRYSF